MTYIKICGLTNMKDVSIVNKYMPDYVGFVFAESKRRVTPLLAKELIKNLMPSIKTVGVFVNESLDNIKSIASICNLDVIQLHGEETPYYCKSIDRTVWKAISVKDSISQEMIRGYEVDALLFDTFTHFAKGGTGKTFDWNIIKELQPKKNIIIAGGLNSNNVENAIDIINPFCVDVSSGVEISGIKDEVKIKNFIKKVRERRLN